MAAVSATLGVTLRAGDKLVIPSDGYYAARTLATGFFATMGVEVRQAPTAGDAQRQCLEGAKLPEGFIRLSAGCEDARDLIADLGQTLDRAAS
jgi:cystathionine beta-lyase/cystathionine gamma-synthase